MNRAADSGGAIRADLSNTTLDSLTVANNTANSDANASGAGGGLSVAPSTTASLANSIIAGNRVGTNSTGTASNLDGTLGINTFNIIGGSATAAGLEVDSSANASNFS